MLEQLNALDHRLFLFFNHLNNPVFDFLMYWVSNKLIWTPLYAYLAWFIYKKFPGRFKTILFFIAVTIVLGDQLSSTVFKFYFMRLRPCHDPLIGPEVHLVNGYCGGMYGFVSGHATNSFALMTFLILLFSKKYLTLQWILLGWALTVSYSRIYLGVHFPGDVIGGALLGTFIGAVTEKMFGYYERKFIHVKIKSNHPAHRQDS